MVMRDISKSVLAKLKNKSKATGIGFQQLLLLFCQEEFLRRLSKSPYADNFILKGGLFIYILSDFESRGTVDMDFLLRNQTNNIDELVERINEIINAKTENPFISFEVIGKQQITIEKEYPGVAVKMIGKVGNTKTPVNIDFGIGDVIVPKAELRQMKSQLNEFEAVDVYTYSLESSVAEKLDAILQRFELTSRMKDFYDIWYISRNFDFDGNLLLAAVKKTLLNRGTEIEDDSIERIKRLATNQVVLSRWSTFSRKMKLQLELSDCVDMIEHLMTPIIHSILLDEVHQGSWISSELTWKNE